MDHKLHKEIVMFSTKSPRRDYSSESPEPFPNKKNNIIFIYV